MKIVEQMNFFDGEPEVARSLLTQLLEDSRLYRNSDDYMALLDFIVRLPNFAPFNAMLLQIQRPGMTYAASAHDWLKRFNRTIKEGARPLLILWPFGPVALVYDLDDTEGDEPLPTDIAQTFRAEGSITTKTIEGFVMTLARLGINMKLIEYGDAHAGHIKVISRSSKTKEIPDYQVRVNATHNSNVQFATLAHELGHLYLGHFGPDKHLNIPERPLLTHIQRELEPESTSYLVCSHYGVKTKSETYLKDFVEKNTEIDNLDLYVMLKASGQVERTLNYEHAN